jgi:hypothetical protein
MNTKATKPRSGPEGTLSISELRTAIDRAENQGIARGDMLLHLTLHDEAKIKRSPSVGVDEVSFADGEMRFVGVKVVVAAGVVSSLEAPAAAA